MLVWSYRMMVQPVGSHGLAFPGEEVLIEVEPQGGLIQVATSTGGASDRSGHPPLRRNSTKNLTGPSGSTWCSTSGTTIPGASGLNT